MCIACETGVDSVDAITATVWRRGFSTVGVEADVPWIYTVGLRWTYGCPELVLVGRRDEVGRAVLHDLVHHIDHHDLMIANGTTACVGAASVRFGPVHHRCLAEGWLGSWSPVAHRLGHGNVSLRALQVGVDELHAFGIDAIEVGSRRTADRAVVGMVDGALASPIGPDRLMATVRRAKPAS